jgi:hypothetical protein
VICDLLVTHHPQSTISKNIWATSGFVFIITFLPKLPPGPKTRLERYATRFSTICAKKSGSKLKKIDEVMTILDFNPPL